VDERW